MPTRWQAIIWPIAGILLSWPLGTNFSEISINFHTFSFKKMPLKMSSAKWWSFCLGLNVLMLINLMSSPEATMKKNSATKNKLILLQCFKLKFSLSHPKMFRKFSSLYNLLNFYLPRVKFNWSSPIFGCHGRPLVLNTAFDAYRLEYLGKVKSMKWLLEAWLLMSPGHQQPWYWITDNLECGKFCLPWLTSTWPVMC